MAEIFLDLIPLIPGKQSQTIEYSKRNNELLRVLGMDEMEGAYLAGVTGLISSSGAPIKTEKELISALVGYTTHAALSELNQKRNDQHLLNGYEGMSLSRFENSN